MSVNQADLEILVNLAKDYVALVDATTITLGQGAWGGLGGKTRNQIVAIINEWDAQTKPLTVRPTPIADT